MSSIKFICYPIFLLIMNGSLHAQVKDTAASQKIAELGSKGDIILGEKNKKAQLKNTPVLLHSKDSICTKEVSQPSKKFRRKQIKKDG